MSAAPEPDHAADPVGMHGALRILVVDADDRTRESIVGILGIRHRFTVVGSAGHVAEALGIARAHRPDVVILDPRLPEVSDGMALIRRLRAMDPTAAILAVGWSPDLEHQALDAGADGFVRKTFKPGDLSNAIGRCMDSRAPEAVESVLEPPADVAAALPDDPSPRPVPMRGAGLIL